MTYDHSRTQKLLSRLTRIMGKVVREGEPKQIHELRTSVRRTEALLKAHGLASEHKRLGKQLKRMRRRAGKVRDIDVQLEALKTVQIGRENGRREELLEYLAEERKRQHKKLADELEHDALSDFRKRLRAAAEEIDRIALQSGSPVQDGDAEPASLPDGIEPLPLAFSELERAIVRFPKLTAGNIHKFRSRCKRIRYIAEMAGEDNEPAVKTVAELKRMQDAIGDWHDWYTLCLTARDVLGKAQNSAMLSAIENMTQAKLTFALDISTSIRRELLKMRKKLFPPVQDAPPKKGAQSASVARSSSALRA